MYKYILVLAGLLASISAFPQALTSDALINEAEQAYMDYNFSEALRLLTNAHKKIRKGDTTSPLRIDQLKEQIQMAQSFMERVEQIEILDSISVPKEDFFKSYRLPASAGHLRGGNNSRVGNDQVQYYFTNEKGNYNLWAAPDTTGYMVIREQSKLIDGNWSEPATLTSLCEEDADVMWPFMMSDGVTIYYASDGEDSMGGLDIMVATRDAADGDFLQPQNLGMPYNSPFDDYLLAIDELNGVGWWATDRNQIPDSITIYLYKVNDLRRNYSPDQENLVDRARLVNWKSTQSVDADFSKLLTTIYNIDPAKSEKPYDFTLPMDKGKIYHYFSDFKNKAAVPLMKKYLADKINFDIAEANLTKLRKKYADSPTESLRNRIINEENSVEKKRSALKQQLSNIYHTERINR